MVDRESLQLQLARVLRPSPTAKELQEDLADTVFNVCRELRRVKVFPNGMPEIDHLVVHAHLERDEVQGLIDTLLKEPRIDKIELFPYGIIDAQSFGARIAIR